MPIHPFKFFLGFSILLPGLVAASVTVYYVPGHRHVNGTTTMTAGVTASSGAAAHTVLNPPPPPVAFNTQFDIQLQSDTPGLSVPQSGAFVGFSIEMSVVNQILGKNASVLQVPFLNLMANIQQRAGHVKVRIGGNTQETAVLVDSTPDEKVIEKAGMGMANVTDSPPLVYTTGLFHMMRQISSLVNVRWFLGIPFMDTNNFQLRIAEEGQAILGDYLLGLQVGNEPDLYARRSRRPPTYRPIDYVNEFSRLVDAMTSDPKIINHSQLIGPNIATGDWQPENIWDTGFVDAFGANLAYLSVEHYPTDNCFARFGIGVPHDPQTIFPSYLNHESSRVIVEPYLNSTAYALSKGKQLIMFETNTASCGGFAGISDSFGAALWGLDYALQLAYRNFAGALMHIGGQNVFYNPFTPPPTNQSLFRQWTIGPMYYTALVMAEVMGASNKSQILDLNANSNNTFTPAYGIYEDGKPERVALINFVTDASGASDITASISVGGGITGQPNATPRQVKVKYLTASSVSQKVNFTWAGQTFGHHFHSDGRLTGPEEVQVIPCDQDNNVCRVKVPAPGFALVFLSEDALTVLDGAPSKTFPTTFLTRTRNTAGIIDPDVLATSNGHSGMGRKKKLGSTSRGSVTSAAGSLRHSSQGVMLSWMFMIVAGTVMR